MRGVMPRVVANDHVGSTRPSKIGRVRLIVTIYQQAIAKSIYRLGALTSISPPAVINDVFSDDNIIGRSIFRDENAPSSRRMDIVVFNHRVVGRCAGDAVAGRMGDLKAFDVDIRAAAYIESIDRCGLSGQKGDGTASTS